MDVKFMLSIVKSCGLQGIDGYIVEVETDVANGFPGFEKVGYIVMKINTYLSKCDEYIQNTI